MNMHPRQRGFTLIELLVVVAILVVLLSLMIPALDKALASAERARCQTNLSHIAKGFHLYAWENRGRAPDENSPVSWDEQLRPYLAHKDIYLCPADSSPVSREIGFSYTWRDSFSSPAYPISKVKFTTARPADLLLVFEEIYNLHAYDMKNAARLDTSVGEFTSRQFEDDMRRRAR